MSLHKYQEVYNKTLTTLCSINILLYICWWCVFIKYLLQRVLGASGLIIEYIVAAIKGGERGVCTVAQGEGIITV